MKKSIIILLGLFIYIGISMQLGAQNTNSTHREIEKKSTCTNPEKAKKEEAKIKEEKPVEQKELIIMPDEASFPKYIMTGDQAKDDAEYARKKAEWIEHNPEKYEQMQKKMEPRAAEREEMELKRNKK